jgi:hypothetical protein
MAMGSENNWFSSITKLGDFSEDDYNYAAINWLFIVVVLFLHDNLNRDKF